MKNFLKSIKVTRREIILVNFSSLFIFNQKLLLFLQVFSVKYSADLPQKSNQSHVNWAWTLEIKCDESFRSGFNESDSVKWRVIKELTIFFFGWAQFRFSQDRRKSGVRRRSTEPSSVLLQGKSSVFYSGRSELLSLPVLRCAPEI